jgi:hypothetical protein
VSVIGVELLTWHINNKELNWIIIAITTRRPRLHSRQSDAPQCIKTLDSTGIALVSVSGLDQVHCAVCWEQPDLKSPCSRSLYITDIILRYWTRSWTNSTHLTSWQSISLWFIVTLFFHILLDVPSSRFPRCFKITLIYIYIYIPLVSLTLFMVGPSLTPSSLS